MSHPSLAERFAALQAERARNWPAAQLADNAHQRSERVRRYDPARHAAKGDAIAPFTLIDRHGAPFTSAQLLAGDPAVLIIFRFGSCPACNIALPYYDETLRPALEEAGVSLIAISPQIPVDAGLIERHGLRIPVYSDPDYRLERALGITFLPDDQPAVPPGQDWIGKTLGTDSYELPQPTIAILAADGRLHDILVSPDWLARPETSAILASLAGLPLPARPERTA